MTAKLLPGLKLEHVRRYVENRLKEFASLDADVAARNAAGIRGLAHKIKGNAALYGMPELGVVAGQLVEALDSADWPEISTKVEALVARLAEDRVRFFDGA